jgi:hypothetical protein
VRSAAAVLVTSALALATPSAPRLTGLWGGERIALDIGPDGARVDYDCAHGDVEGAFALDRRGRFELRGTHVEEHGGPVREGAAHAEPVRYSGTVKGDRMTLRVTRASSGEPIGTFTLGRGREPSIVKCR